MSHGYDVAAHSKVMRQIARSFSETPLVLKGGTALLLCYGLDRFSTDLDFDSEKKISLEHRVLESINRLGINPQFSMVKDTPIVTKGRLTYGAAKHNLMIEVSHRDDVMDEDICVIGGIKTFTPAALLRKKLYAIQGPRPRTAARDIYDIGFIVKNFPEAAPANAVQLKALTKDINGLSQQFAEAFAIDSVLGNANLDGILLELEDAVGRLPTSSLRPPLKSLSPKPPERDPPQSPPGLSGL